MKEHQVWIKKKIICVGFYNREVKEVIFEFTKDEFLNLLKCLKVKSKDILYEVKK